jgi:teichoic acid glycerol-phosphate primase
MVREILVSLYLSLFKIIFYIFNNLPLGNKVVFVVSFSENNKSVFNEMLRQGFSCRTFFLTTPKLFSTFSNIEEAETLIFNMKKPIQFVESIYHLATAKVVFVDNYYGFLADITFRDEVECIQLWHANGAIKRFGLKDPSIKNRTPKAIERFNRVYNKFSKVIVGSDVMGDIFKKAFSISEDRIEHTGVPRTDIFFDENLMNESIVKLEQEYHFLKQKKVILYAPTYRENELHSFNFKLDIKKIFECLDESYVLLIKLHPAIKSKIEIPTELKNSVYDFTHYKDLNELLFVTDILITDYSSIPFEFCLLSKPIIFFSYDYEEYKVERGFWEEYSDSLPGPVVKTTEDLCKIIKNNNFNIEKLNTFSEKWNKYSKGKSSSNVIDLIKEKVY